MKSGRGVFVHSRECAAAAQGIAAAYLILRAKFSAREAIDHVTVVHGTENAALNDADGEYLRGLGEIEGAMADRELQRQQASSQLFFKHSVTHASCP